MLKVLFSVAFLVLFWKVRNMLSLFPCLLASLPADLQITAQLMAAMCIASSLCMRTNQQNREVHKRRKDIVA